MSEPRVVVVRSGPDHPWVGQLVKLDVQLWRPVLEEGKAPPFGFSEPHVAGALAHFREEAPPPDEQEQDGQTWLVQHRTLVVFPQIDGVVHIPSITARWDEGDAVKTARSEALEFTAALPPRSDERLVVAPRLDVEQTLDRSLAGLRVGDGFTRTVVVSADDSDPLVLPTLEFSPVRGLSVYPAAPQDASNAERGNLTASRTFSATYVVERVGHYELPALSLEWLEPNSGRYSVTQAPEVDFWGWPNPHLGLSMWGTSTASGWLGFGLVAAVLALAATTLRRRIRGGPFRWERRLADARAEQRAFRRVLRIRRHGSPLETLRALYAWLRLRVPYRTDRTLEPLRTASKEFATELAAVEHSAFLGGPSPNTGRGSTRALRVARRQLARFRAPKLSLNRRR